MTNNLLHNLFNWAHRQDENFLTEAFVHLLRHLLVAESAIGLDLVKRLSGGVCEIAVHEVELISISTQVTYDLGRPDIEIRTPNCLIFIEVKKESGLGHLQIDRYRRILDQSHLPVTKLVTLTRYPLSFLDDGEKPDLELRWIHIGEWLEKYRPSNVVTQHLISQFIEFLHLRGICMEKVGWQLIDGQKALRSLIAILGEAIDAHHLKIYQRSASWDWIGYYLEGKSCFLGYCYDEPTYIRFEGYLPEGVDCDALTTGELIGRQQWNNRLDLASEERGFFFAQSKANQFKMVEEFLADSWQTFQQFRAKEKSK